MLGGVAWFAEGGAPVEAGQGGAGRHGQADNRIPTGEGGRQAVHLQSASNQSHGLNAEWSGGRQQDAVNLLSANGFPDGGDSFVDGAAHVRLVAVEVDYVGVQIANDAFGRHVSEVL